MSELFRVPKFEIFVVYSLIFLEFVFFIMSFEQNIR